MCVELKIFLLVSEVLIVNDAARILAVFPMPSVSHQVVFRPLTQELAKRGHEVIVITPNPAFPKGQTPNNITEIDVHNVSYEKWQTYVAIAGNHKTELEKIRFALIMVQEIFEAQVKTKEFQEILYDSSRKFDLLLTEACVPYALGLSHIFKNTPVIQISSLAGTNNNYEAFGAAMHPLLYPDIFHKKIQNLSFLDKLSELYNHYLFEMMFRSLYTESKEYMKNLFGQDTPTLKELNNNVDLLLLNVHSIWDSNRPVPPNVIYLGGMHQQPQTNLTTELQNYLDSSKNGVIYVSFGGSIRPSLFPPEIVQAMINVFSKLPYDVLWKWDEDVLQGQSKNIKISKWLPQSDLLRHPKIKMFITQCGLQSTDESISAGVPLIGIPIIADQFYNAEKYVVHKIGLKLQLGTLTEEQLETAIISIANNKSYKENILHLRSVMNDQPQTPLQRAVWWTEHVLRHHGARHLRSPAHNITWMEYLEIDLVLTCLVLLLTAIVSIAAMLYIAYELLRQLRLTVEKDEKEKSL